MFQDITLEKFLRKQKEFSVIDVRSPGEFNESAVPGSVNIPVFNDQERTEVGTLYKQVSPEAAREKGLEIFAAKLPEFVKAFQQIKGEKVVYCWRGGMRSKTAATVTDLAGEKVHRLQGGIRAYRKWVVERLETLEIPQKAIVLNGFTGTGKTEILHSLREEGMPVLDLEGYANHRGSIFGPIGLNPHTQKKFDSLLLHDLDLFQHHPYLLMEGESKRIGKAVIPEAVMQKKDQGLQLFLELPMEQRVQQILKEYQPWNHQEACLQAFHYIKKRIHTPAAEKIESNLLSGSYGDAIRLLLEYYYDPRYRHAGNQYDENQKMTIQAATVEEACQKVRDKVASITAKQTALH